MSVLLDEVFKKENWEIAIAKAMDKGVDQSVLKRLCSPHWRALIKAKMLDNSLIFLPPHMGQVEKDTPGEFRTVIISEPEARVLDSIINNALFKLFPNRIHPRAKAYQIGISTGKVAEEVTEQIMKSPRKYTLGCKYDFSKFFDTVSKESIYRLLGHLETQMECEYGTDPVINYIRRTWDSDYVFDLDNVLTEQYMGIRQGNAISAFLANAILYELDEYMSRTYDYYVRYSDDLIVFGNASKEHITNDINRIIHKYNVTLNPKKVEVLRRNEWFKFLGYTFCNDKRSISQRRIKNFQKEIEARTIRKRNITYDNALNSVYSYFYKGDGVHSPASQILKYVNSESDLKAMDDFIKDCLRAVITGKKKLYGLGYVKTGNGSDGTIPHTTGKNVAENRKKVPYLNGYDTVICFRNAIKTSKTAYDTMVRSL